MNGDRHMTIRETVGEFDHVIELGAPYDERHWPDRKGGGYGIGSGQIKMLVVKEKKAIQFMFSMPWFTRQTIPGLLNSEEMWRREHPYYTPLHFKASGWDVGYHSPHPMYNEHDPIDDDCPWTGGKCYYDGSGLRADAWLTELEASGWGHIWAKLEQDWRDRFEGDPR